MKSVTKKIIPLAVILIAIVIISTGCTGNKNDQTPNNNNITNNNNQTNHMNKNNILETAAQAGQFNTLASAIKAAELTEILSGPGPFTVFAPTDEAFAKLPAGTLDSLLENKDELAKILTYHVISGKVMATDVINLSEAETVQGGKLTINASDNGVKINQATVTQTDIEASNGIIHVIDAVLLPE